MRRIALITGITSLVLIFEWLLIAGGILTLNKLEPARINISSYQTWFMSFSIPDQWIVFWCILSFFAALRNKNSAIPFSMLAGSSMIFLALCTITFYAQNSMLLDLNSYQLFEDSSCLWLLLTGGWLIYFGILKFEIKR